jgi:type VI secretion system protein ImpK
VGKSFADTIAGQTLNFDMSKALGGTRDMSSLSTDLFLIAIRMREAEDLGEPASLRKLIMYYLDLFKKNCKVVGVGDESIAEALYAIVALIDETVLSAPGPCRDYWFARPVQLDLFGDNIAGEEFFRKLERLLDQAEKKREVLEVYYLCLSLGFEGKFKIFNSEERVRIIEETGRKLSKSRMKQASGISPHGTRNDYVPVRQRNSSGGGFPLWAGALVAACVCAGTYLVTLALASNELERVLKVVGGMGMR